MTDTETLRIVDGVKPVYLNSEKPICLVCGQVFGFKWSDTHGIGVCTVCCMPYRIIHYEETKDENGILQKAKVVRPPMVTLTAKGLEIAKAYWESTKRRVFPGYYDMPGSYYSGHSEQDMVDFEAWYVAQGHSNHGQ